MGIGFLTPMKKEIEPKPETFKQANKKYINREVEKEMGNNP